MNDIAEEGTFVINDRPIAVGAVDSVQPIPYNEADALLFTTAGSFDPEGEPLRFQWEFGDDGTGVDPTSQGPAPTHQYGDDGTFRVTLNADDGFSGVDIFRFPVQVVNVDPEATIDSVTDETGAELGRDVPGALVGLTIDLAGSFRDVGWLDTHEAAIDWGDRGSDGPVPTVDNVIDVGADVRGWTAFAHVFDVPATRTMTLTVRDDDGGSDSPTRDILIVDAAGAVALLVDRFGTVAGASRVVHRLERAFDKLSKSLLESSLLMIRKSIDEIVLIEAVADFTFDKGFLALAAKSEVVAALAQAREAASSSRDAGKIAEAESLVLVGDERLGRMPRRSTRTSRPGARYWGCSDGRSGGVNGVVTPWRHRALLHESISSRSVGSSARFSRWSRQTSGDRAQTSD